MEHERELNDAERECDHQRTDEDKLDDRAAAIVSRP